MGPTRLFLIGFNQFRISMSIIDQRFFHPVSSKKSRLMTYIQPSFSFFIDSYGNSLIYFENIALSSTNVSWNEPPKTFSFEIMIYVDLQGKA
jgi:hypothetical protein